MSFAAVASNFSLCRRSFVRRSSSNWRRCSSNWRCRSARMLLFIVSDAEAACAADFEAASAADFEAASAADAEAASAAFFVLAAWAAAWRSA